jgi:hypothetical protein
MTDPTGVTTVVSVLNAISPTISLIAWSGQPRAEYEIRINASFGVCQCFFLRQLLLRSDFTELFF